MKKIASIVTVFALLAVALPVSASHGSWGSFDINIETRNTADITNIVSTSASTGGNTANGGSSLSIVRGRGDNANNEVTGGDGGVVVTGNAAAFSDVLNKVNTSRTIVTSNCACRGDINVGTRNAVSAANIVGTTAFTGGNTADGASAESRVRGAFMSWGENGDNEVTGGNGGTVATGDSDAIGSVVNRLNSTITRIRR